MIQIIDFSISFLVLSLLVYLVLVCVFGTKMPGWESLRTNWHKSAFFIALIGMSGSLYFSEIALYPPCHLCWWQRIFIYPLVFLFASSFFSRQKLPQKTLFWFTILGLLISLYHNVLYYHATFFSNGISSGCSAFGKGEDCLKTFILEFGFITIPLMSFAVFLALFMILFPRKHKN